MLKQLQWNKAFSLIKNTNNVSASAAYKMLGEPASVVQIKLRWNKT